MPYDRAREDREEIARRLARERGATLVPPFDDAYVIAGQGTVGVEICEDLSAQGLSPDIVMMPASGGGLAAGISLAVKERYPAARILTVEPADFDDHIRSFRAGARMQSPPSARSICDALLCLEPGEITFEITRRLVGEGLAVTDEEVRAAMRFAFAELKLVVEPGGAVALAAILAKKIDVRGKIAIAVLSGGNVDAKVFAEAIGA
jgi:threonine dehydratase